MYHNTNCKICWKVFCCADHRRNHEVKMHTKEIAQLRRIYKKRLITLARPCSSLLVNPHLNHLNIGGEILFGRPKSLNRKRKVDSGKKISLVTSKLEFTQRSILVPKRRLQKVQKKPNLETLVESNESVQEMDSKIAKFGNSQNTQSPEVDSGFTTSTPILGQEKEVHGNPLNENSSSYKETPVSKYITPNMESRKSIKRKLSDACESLQLYTTAPTIPESPDSINDNTHPPDGIFSSVINVFRRAINKIPGPNCYASQDKELTDPSWVVALTPSGTKRMRTTYFPKIYARPTYKSKLKNNN